MNFLRKHYKLLMYPKLMAQATVETAEEITRKDIFPLRIFGEEDGRYLCCPHGLKDNDDLKVAALDGDPRIIDCQATCVDGGFDRHFLVSRIGRGHLVTATGYKFTGPVEVYSWKARDFPDRIGEGERPAIETLARVRMVHVEGFDSAVAEHRRRINNSRADLLSPEEAVKAYDAMRNYVPRYSNSRSKR